MTKIEIAKTLTSVVVGAGTTKIVAGIVRHNTDPETVADKVTILSGSFVLGSMVADATKKYTDARIDEVVDWWQKNVKKND